MLFSKALRIEIMNYCVLAVVMQVLLWAGSTGSALAAGGQPNSPSLAHKAGKPAEDLPNFHEVHPFLYRSGEPTQAGLKKIKDMGVKTVIDLRAPSERHFDEGGVARGLGLNYIMLTMTSAPPTDEQVDTLLSTIKKAENDPASGKVLVHCAHGSDRTGCMIGIWRVSQEGWSYAEAYKEMRKYWFTPKFTRLADAVKHHVNADATANAVKR